MEVHRRTNGRRVIQWNRGWLSFEDTGRDKFDSELTHETALAPVAAAAFCERLFVVSVLGVCSWARSGGTLELCGWETEHRWIYKHKQLPTLMSWVMTMCWVHVTDWIHIKCVTSYTWYKCTSLFSNHRMKHMLSTNLIMSKPVSCFIQSLSNRQLIREILHTFLSLILAKIASEKEHFRLDMTMYSLSKRIMSIWETPLYISPLV